MSPADSASRAGAMPEASGDSSSGTFGVNMRKLLAILFCLSLLLNLFLLYHLRFEIVENLEISNPSAIVEAGLSLKNERMNTFTGEDVSVPVENWPTPIRALKPSRVWLSNEGLMIQTFGTGLTRDGGYVVSPEARPARQLMYFYDTWFPNLYRWETTINE